MVFWSFLIFILAVLEHNMSTRRYLKFALLTLHSYYTAVNATTINDIDAFSKLPVGHACTPAPLTGFTTFDRTSILEPCNILLSPDSNTVLIVNPGGFLELFQNTGRIWSSCDESGLSDTTCHTKTPGNVLKIWPIGHILTLIDPTATTNDFTQKVPTWKKGFGTNPQSEATALIVQDLGHIVLMGGNAQNLVLWSTEYDHDDEVGILFARWTLIVNQQCNANGDGYFGLADAISDEQIAQKILKFGTKSDGVYSNLAALSEGRYKSTSSGKYQFRMSWPSDAHLLDIVWEQSSNPTQPSVSGFEVCVLFNGYSFECRCYWLANQSLMDPYQKR